MSAFATEGLWFARILVPLGRAEGRDTFEPVILREGVLPREYNGVVRTNILHFAARVVVTSEDALPLHRARGVERGEGTADDHFHAEHGSLAAALRPPASESRPTHRRRDRRYRPRSPSLDGAGVAWHDASLPVTALAARMTRTRAEKCRMSVHSWLHGLASQLFQLPNRVVILRIQLERLFIILDRQILLARLHVRLTEAVVDI